MREFGADVSVAIRFAFTRAEVLACVAVAALLCALLVPALVPARQRAAEQASLVACRENLRKIGAGLLLYAQDNHGALPLAPALINPHPELTSALAPKYVTDPKLFYCPSEQRPALSYSEPNFRAGIIGYFYYAASQPGDDQNLSKFLRTGLSWPRAVNTSLDPKTWVASDIWLSGDPTAHSAYKKGVNYLMLDGAVDFVSESPRQAFH